MITRAALILEQLTLHSLRASGLHKVMPQLGSPQAAFAALQYLANKGLCAKASVSTRGWWRITPLGEAFLEEQKNPEQKPKKKHTQKQRQIFQKAAAIRAENARRQKAGIYSIRASRHAGVSGESELSIDGRPMKGVSIDFE